jgi:hypothetical protein
MIGLGADYGGMLVHFAFRRASWFVGLGSLWVAGFWWLVAPVSPYHFLVFGVFGGFSYILVFGFRIASY